MNPTRFRFILPDGQLRERQLERGDPASTGASVPTLAEWMEAEHLPLNTRCGGRGLCRGCRIRLGEEKAEPVRACQIPLASLHDSGTHTIHIPEASFRDHSLTGVSVFEIGGGEPVMKRRPGIGLALDIGTTTVAAALWDLQSGQCLATGSAANEQRRFGDNVLARIDHAVSRGGSSPELQAALVRDSLLPLLQKVCTKAGIQPEAITECLAAGNTVMEHAFAGADLSGFSAYPFKPVFLSGITLSSTEIGFPVAFPVSLAPNPGPFVGADIAVGALASGMLARPDPSLLIDFGTNGEILLRHHGGYLATATAAGPAFEGGRLSCGSPAGTTVISSLILDGTSWSWRLSGEGRGKPAGISGAAYIDFIALACTAGILSEMGRFDPAHPSVITHTDGDGDAEKRVHVTRDLYVSEADVAELMQAKAAIAAGVLTLLEEAGLGPADLTTLYIAGGFGYHLDRRHAVSVGLVPAVPMEQIRVIGNASLGGTSLLLQSDDPAPLESLLEACTVVELNQMQSFEDHFIDCMSLSPVP
ncbi:MAG: ASKHA domain-containing protein [Oceanipulchritudo sp.]